MLDNNDLPDTNPESSRLLRGGGVSFGIAIVLIILLPILLTKCSVVSLGNLAPNEIGDTLGGIMGPAAGILAAGLTFLAFWSQYDANITQRRQFNTGLVRERARAASDLERFNLELESQKNALKSQEKQALINLFEARFYNMLNIHRDNINSLEIEDKIKGRKVFVDMLDELRVLHDYFKIFHNELHVSYKIRLNAQEIYNAAYLSFFFGIGEKSTPIVQDLVGNNMSKFIQKVHADLYYKKKMHGSKKKLKLARNSQTLEWPNQYRLGVGHQRRLSHYFRHLFQIVKFVDEQDQDLLNYEAKYSYLSNLRAQLSTHEQMMLYYNALSVLGQPWLNKDLSGENHFEKYCLIKSIPLNAADIFTKPDAIFSGNKNKHGKILFEWLDIKDRALRLTTY